MFRSQTKTSKFFCTYFSEIWEKHCIKLNFMRSHTLSSIAGYQKTAEFFQDLNTVSEKLVFTTIFLQFSLKSFFSVYVGYTEEPMTYMCLAGHVL